MTSQPLRAATLCCLLLWAATQSLHAASTQPLWQHTGGPYGGAIQSLLTLPDGSLVAATLHSGVFVSAADEPGWTRASWPLAVADVRALTLAGERLLAASYGAGLASSEDGGYSWTPLATGYRESVFLSLAASERLLVAGARRGVVLRSFNNGYSWQRIQLPDTREDISDILIDGQNIWVATSGSGVYLSEDRGVSFKPRVAGLRNRHALRLIKHDDHILVSTRAGLFRYQDRRWRPLPAPASGSAVIALYSNGTALYAGTLGAGAHTSSDGAAWKPVGERLSTQTIPALASAGGEVFAATLGQGVHVFRDDHWQPSSYGLTATHVHAVAALGETFYAATDAGFFKSPDAGRRWIEHNDGLADTNLTALAVTGIEIVTASSGGGLFRSVDDGLSWRFLAEAPDQATIHALTSGAGNLYAATNLGLYASTDGGESWQRLKQLGADFKTVAMYGNILIAGNLNGEVWASGDAGDSWQSISWEHSLLATAFTLDSERVYVSTPLGLMRSIDLGRSWQNLVGAPGESEIHTLAFAHPYLVAGTRGGGVLRLIDGGFTWRRASPDVGVNALSLVGDFRYLATDQGVLKSSDFGASWIEVDQGLDGSDVFAIDTAGESLYAATGSGLYVSDDHASSWHPVGAETVPDAHLVKIRRGDFLVSTSEQPIMRSLDRGLNWESIEQLEDVTVLVLDTDSEYLVGTDRGLYVSGDRGDSWHRAAADSVSGAVHGIARTNVSLFILMDGKLLRSDSAMEHWEQLSIGTGQQFLHATAASENELFVAAEDEVWRSPDQGQTWIPLQQPGEAPAEFLAFAGEHVFAGGADGLWYASRNYPAPEASSVRSSSLGLPALAALLAICCAVRRRNAGARW